MPRDSGEARRAAFEAEALPHLDNLYTAAAYLFGGDRHRAGDLVQETVLRAYRFFDRFEPGTNCRGWLLTILHNTFRNQYRAGQKERGRIDIEDPTTALEVAEATGEEGPETAMLAAALDPEVAQALADLPEEFRSAIVLVDLQELTYEESARALECPIGTVRSRLARGRRLLARKLATYAAERGLLRERQ